MEATIIKRILQISPAYPGWFVVHELEGEASYDPIAFWALCETEHGPPAVFPVASFEFHADGPGPYMGVALDSNFIGVKGPDGSDAEWQKMAKQRHEERNAKK